MTTRSRLVAIICGVLLVAGACTSEPETTTTGLPTLETPTTTAEGDSETTDADSSDTGSSNEGEPEAGTSDDDEPVDPEIAYAEFEKCMADHGIEMAVADGASGNAITTFESEEEIPEGDVLDGSSFEDFEAAQEACDPILEDAFGSFEMTPEQEAELADEMLALERCLSDKGFDIDMDGNGFAIEEDINFEAFEEAMSACDVGFESVEVGS